MGSDTVIEKVVKSRKTAVERSTDSTDASGLPMSRRQRSVALKKNAIQNAALTVFSMYGFHGSTVEQIADLAGVSKANLLYYFPSKDDLYLFVLTDLLSVWLTPFEALGRGDDPYIEIREYIKKKLELSRDFPEASRLFCLEMIQGAPLLKPTLEGSLRKLVKEKAAVIKTWVDEKRIAPIDPYHLIFMLWATTQHYADFHVQIEALTGKTLDNDRFLKSAIENIQKIILDGIQPRAE